MQSGLVEDGDLRAEIRQIILEELKSLRAGPR